MKELLELNFLKLFLNHSHKTETILFKVFAKLWDKVFIGNYIEKEVVEKTAIVFKNFGASNFVERGMILGIHSRCLWNLGIQKMIENSENLILVAIFLQLEIVSFVSGMIYFGYSLVMVFSFWIVTGTVGFFSTYAFVRTIYSAVKID